MVPLLGRPLILLALLAASAGSVVGFVAGARPSAAGWKRARRLAYAFAALMVLANLVMEYALLTHDFSVSYVAHVGSRSVPTWVSIVSLWSSLEGSILFWGLVMGVYIGVATFWNADKYPEYMPYAVGVWLACGAFFSFLLAGPAQPFATVLSPALDGPGPNPLLQNHYLMVIHPPFLYSGYVGMTIPFGLACAALLVGRLGNDFIRPLRNFLLLSWIFLTVAIVLGGWWAYEVLGWGGYWAWDPVENASFLPWLVVTAYLHSVMIQERKDMLKIWNLSLIGLAFGPTLFGTFITRSGVISSVHSFTQSGLGPYFLTFLIIVTLAYIALLIFRSSQLRSPADFESYLSREAAFLFNNLFLVGIAFAVFWGTIFPVLSEAVRGVKITVGPPFFNRVNGPLALGLVFLMGVGPLIAWRRTTADNLLKSFAAPIILGVSTGVVSAAMGIRQWYVLTALSLAAFVMGTIIVEFRRGMNARRHMVSEPRAKALVNLVAKNNRRYGGYVIHVGVIVA